MPLIGSAILSQLAPVKAAVAAVETGLDALEFAFPKWHKQIRLQVWQYASPLSEVISPENEIKPRPP